MAEFVTVSHTNIQNIRKIVDDIIIYDPTYEEHVKHVREVLERCRQRKISLKREKFVFAQPKAKFSGYIVGPDGFAADPSLTKAIREFPRPTNITEMRSFLGLANQLSNSISTAMEPLRPLLKTKNHFMWDASHDQAFDATKQALGVTPTLAYYDPGCPTALHTDASRLLGLGFVLKQKKADGKWHLIQAGSRFLTDTETRYAMIELEMLAVAWAVKKCRIFLEGLSQFDIITDHRPLITISMVPTYLEKCLNLKAVLKSAWFFNLPWKWEIFLKKCLKMCYFAHLNWEK